MTGQLTTTFAETPQVPFTSFKLKFDGGARAVLSSPPTCGPNTTTTDDDALVGQPRRDAERRIRPQLGARRRPVRENAGRAALRARLRRRTGKQPKPAPSARSRIRHRPQPTASRSSKASTSTLPPGMTAQARRHPLLPRGGARRGRGERRQRRERPRAARRQPGRQRRDRRRHRPGAAPASTARPSSQAPTKGPLCPWQ